MIVEGKVGYREADRSAEEKLRLTKTCSQAVADGHSHWAETVGQGKVFTLANTAGVAPGTSVTTTAGMALWNPPTSKVLLVLIECTLAWASGTLGAGKLWHCLHVGQAAKPGGSALAPNPNYAGGGNANGQGFTTATGLTAPVQQRIMAAVTALAADAGTALPIRDLLDGLLIVPPGCAYSLQEVGAAGTTPLVFLSYCWEEVPV